MLDVNMQRTTNNIVINTNQIGSNPRQKGRSRNNNKIPEKNSLTKREIFEEMKVYFYDNNGDDDESKIFNNK